MIILSTIVFLIIFSFIVLVHEMGHFFSARRHNVHVEEFGLGIPPRALTLWKDKKNCIYSLNWIPFGGFVKMKGEDVVNEKERKSKGSFASKSLFARMEIILAGVIMNYITAIIVMTFLFSIGSTPILLNKESVYEYINKGIIVTEQGVSVVAIDDGPAKEAGLEVGDIVKSINGIPVNDAQEIKNIQKSGVKFSYSILRKKLKGDTVISENQLNIPITSNEEGKIKVAFSIIPPFKEIKEEKYLPHKAFLHSINLSLEIALATVQAFKNLIVQIFTQGQVPSNVSGPVGIASMTYNIVEAADYKALFKFVALLSLSLAIMNVLPIPALDGGRFLFLIVEGIFRKPIKPSWEAKIHSISFLLLILLIFIVTGSDIYRIIVGP